MKPAEFNVLLWDVNGKTIQKYNVIPYFIEQWKEDKKRKFKLWNNLNEKTTKMPETFNEFKQFIESNSLYQFWSRCQYEILVGGFPPDGNQVKIDVHQQIMNNIDVVTSIFMKCINPKKH